MQNPDNLPYDEYLEAAIYGDKEIRCTQEGVTHYAFFNGQTVRLSFTPREPVQTVPEFRPINHR